MLLPDLFLLHFAWKFLLENCFYLELLKLYYVRIRAKKPFKIFVDIIFVLHNNFILYYELTACFIYNNIRVPVFIFVYIIILFLLFYKKLWPGLYHSKKLHIIRRILLYILKIYGKFLLPLQFWYVTIYAYGTVIGNSTK